MACVSSRFLVALKSHCNHEVRTSCDVSVSGASAAAFQRRRLDELRTNQSSRAGPTANQRLGQGRTSDAAKLGRR
jgi:hypothetical protein